MCSFRSITATKSAHLIVLLEGSSRARAVIDIGVTTKQHGYIAWQLLAAHAITACDTVAFV